MMSGTKISDDWKEELADGETQAKVRQVLSKQPIKSLMPQGA